MMLPAHDVVLGVLVSDRHRLELTGADALWLARALVGEAGTDAADGPEGLAIASTMLRRWATVNDSRGARSLTPLWPTFGELLQAYCQPINPRWADRGTPEQQARRARIASMAWEEVPERVRRLSLDVLSGRLRLTARPAVDFAAPSLVRERLEANDALEEVRVPGARNAFLSDPVSRAAREPRVEPATSPPLGPVLALLAFVGGALLLARLGGLF